MIWKRLLGDRKSKSSTSANPRICPNCNSSPVALDHSTGRYFNYCSKSCAAQARGDNSSQNGSLVLSMCEQCKSRPKFRDGTKVYQHCGRTCAKLAGSHGTAPGSAHSMRSRTNGPNCQTPGCASSVFVDANGVASKYCKRAHRQWGERGCISCRAAPRNGALVMCRPCHDRALGVTPAIIEVPEDHEIYKSVKTQFEQTWRHSTKCPEVRAVYKIVNTTASLDKYKQYLDGVEARGNFASTGRSRGNENRRWHGTQRKCNIGDKGVTTFCADTGCLLCSIIQTSFNVKFSTWGWFGTGIYTSSTSSNSNDYSRNQGITSGWKALLLNKVVVGKGMKLTQLNTTLTQPPPGYDSVLAEVVHGGVLSYDELMVYNNDAVRPSYLVMYESP